MPRVRSCLAVLALALVSAAVPSSPAQDTPREPGADRPVKTWSFSAGAAVLAFPEYPGSEETRVLAVPFVGVTYKDRVYFGPGEGRSATGAGLGLGAYLVRGRHVTWSVDLGADLSRKERRADALAGMGDRGSRVYLSTGAAWRWDGGWRTGLSVGRALNGPKGLRARVDAAYERRFAEVWFAGAGLNAVAGDADDLSDDFGIDAAQAERRAALLAAGDPRLRPGDARVFEPSRGLREIGAGLQVGRSFGPHWRGVALAGLSRIAGDAADSPLVRERTNLAAGVFVSREF